MSLSLSSGPCLPSLPSSPGAQEPMTSYGRAPACLGNRTGGGSDHVQGKWMQTPKDVGVLPSGFLLELLELSADRRARRFSKRQAAPIPGLQQNC